MGFFLLGVVLLLLLRGKDFVPFGQGVQFLGLVRHHLLVQAHRVYIKGNLGGLLDFLPLRHAVHRLVYPLQKSGDMHRAQAKLLGQLCHRAFDARYLVLQQAGVYFLFLGQIIVPNMLYRLVLGVYGHAFPCVVQ
jgi:hypothetical protein